MSVICEKKGTSPRGRQSRVKRSNAAERLKLVKLHVEDSIPVSIIAKETGVHPSSIYDWCRQYHAHGEAWFQTRSTGGMSTEGGNAVIKERITSFKQQNPQFGVKRISQFLRRMFFLPASPEKVRQTLHKAGLMKPMKKPKKNPQKPRFFERATPNQMWQSDIFTFRLLGANAYLIGFMDDYSRYMVGLGLYRSQTAEHVLEVYRKAAAEYGVPKEQLTDNGRQYANWRGKTRFQMELQKDKVHHIRSTPHHPQTLGKIERFWKTIWDEFLARAQFESFESAEERVKYWVKHYNHQRPNQGIEGLCPADRFFEIRNEVKAMMAKGIEENALELALRGKPKDPFYMVGRLGEQAVVIHAEKGEIKMMVDGKTSDKAITYDIGAEHETNDGKEGKTDVQCAGEVPGSAVAVGAEQEIGSDNEGDGDKLDAAEPLAATGDAGDDIIAVSEVGGSGEAADAACEAAEAVGGADAEETDPAGEAAAETAGTGKAAEGVNGHTGAGQAQGGTDNQGTQRAVECNGGREEPGDQPEELLQVGKEGALGDDGRPSEPKFRSARLGVGRGEGGAEEAAGRDRGAEGIA
jgi:transposase